MFEQLLDAANKLGYKLASALGEAAAEPVSQADMSHMRKAIIANTPMLRSALPYDSVTGDSLFLNKSSHGFGFYLAPRAGADEQLVKAHANLIKSRLPAGFDMTVMLFKHPYVAQDLFRGFKDILKKGGIYASIAEMSIRYHINAIKKGYKNKRNIPAQLCDYQCFLFVSTKIKNTNLDALRDVRLSFESELQVMGYHSSRLDAKDFTILMRALISPTLDEIEWPDAIYQENKPLSASVVKQGTKAIIEESHTDLQVPNTSGEMSKTRMISMGIEKNAKNFALWSQPDLFANIYNFDKGIQCSFLLSFTVRGVDRDEILQEAKSKSESLEKSNNAIQRKFNPDLVDELKDWKYVCTEIAKGNLTVHDTFFNLVLFSDEENARKHVAQTISSYREFGFELVQKPMCSWNRYLASLPFLLTEGMFEDLKALDQTERMSNFTCANMMPTIGDFKGSPKGMLLPTYRHQLVYVDTFDGKSLPISNFNFVTVGSPGSGKSLLNQWRILNGLASGEQIFVLDLGDSYKHLCELVGGTYINAANIALNPFTLFDFDGEVEIDGETRSNHSQIRDLLAIMASPNAPLSSIQNDYLLEAVMECHRKTGNKTCMDDVLDELARMEISGSAHRDSRLSDLIIHLKKFSKQGMYGHMFNAETPFLANPGFVVLEMGEFENNPELLAIVMFVMILVIQGQFYHSDRNRRKLCIIDEAWRFIANNSNPVSARFIEQGFRTARKYNAGFGVIFQLLGDMLGSLQGQAIAASSDTKFILRQGNFEHYIKENPNAFDERQKRLIRDFGEASAQGFSNVMVQYGNAYTFHRYFADPYTRVLFSSNAEEFGEIESLVQQGISLHQAVYQVAERRYGEELCEA